MSTMTIGQKIAATATAVKAVWTTSKLHLSQWFRGLSASWSSPSYESLTRKVYRNPYAGRGLSLIAHGMASVPLVVLQRQADGTEKPVPDHELLKLFRRPNRRQPWMHFVDALVAHLFCGGELFIERRGPLTGSNKGKPRELHLHSPGRFVDFIRKGYESADFQETVSRAGTDAEEIYRQAVPGEIVGYRLALLDGTVKDFAAGQVHHARTYNPTDEERGLPLILGAARAIQLMESSDDWNKALSQNGGRIPGYFRPNNLAPGQQLTSDQVEQSQAVIDGKVKDRRSSNMPMVLNGAFDFIEGGVSPKDADWLEGDKHNGRKVMGVLGVPSALLGDEKAGSLTDAGIDSEMKALYVLAVLPRLDWLLGELNAWLIPLYGEDVRLAYDTDAVEALQENVEKKYARLVKACGGTFMTVNEAREEVNLKKLGAEHDVLKKPAAPVVAGKQEEKKPNGEPEPLRLLRGMGVADFDDMLKLVA